MSGRVVETEPDVWWWETNGVLFPIQADGNSVYFEDDGGNRHFLDESGEERPNAWDDWVGSQLHRLDAPLERELTNDEIANLYIEATTSPEQNPDVVGIYEEMYPERGRGQEEDARQEVMTETMADFSDEPEPAKPENADEERQALMVEAIDSAPEE